MRLAYEEWKALCKAAAIEDYAREAAEDAMIPYVEGKAAAERMQAAAHGPNAARSYSLPDLLKYDWRVREWFIGYAILAIQRCGYKIVKEDQ